MVERLQQKLECLDSRTGALESGKAADHESAQAVIESIKAPLECATTVVERLQQKLECLDSRTGALESGKVLDLFSRSSGMHGDLESSVQKKLQQQERQQQQLQEGQQVQQSKLEELDERTRALRTGTDTLRQDLTEMSREQRQHQQWQQLQEKKNATLEGRLDEYKGHLQALDALSETLEAQRMAMVDAMQQEQLQQEQQAAPAAVKAEVADEKHAEATSEGSHDAAIETGANRSLEQQKHLEQEQHVQNRKSVGTKVTEKCGPSCFVGVNCLCPKLKKSPKRQMLAAEEEPVSSEATTQAAEQPGSSELEESTKAVASSFGGEDDQSGRRKKVETPKKYPVVAIPHEPYRSPS